MSTTTITRTASPAVRPVRPTTPAVAACRTHLTRRGRLVLVSLLALLLFAAFSVGRSGAEGATSATPVHGVEQTVVQPGETLWEDPRPVIDQIRRLNELETPGLQAGQQLLLPTPA
jgi:hypothetical protein